MADTKLTQQQVIAAITEAVRGSHGLSLAIGKNVTDAQIAADASHIRSKAELDSFLTDGYLPTHGFSETALAQVFGKPRGQIAPPILGGEIISPGKAIAGLTRAILRRSATKAGAEVAAEGVGTFAKTATKEEVSNLYQMTYRLSKEEADAMAADQVAAEAAGTADKASRLKNAATWAKNHKIKATIGAAAVLGVGQMASKSGQTPAASTDVVTAQSESDMAQAIANANAAGIDVNTYINSAAGKQLGLNTNNVQAMLTKYGVGTGGLVGINAGVYTGDTITHKLGTKGHDIPISKPTLLSLNQWKQSLPVSDPVKLNEYKQKFIAAGVLSPSSGLPELQKAWETYGQMSLDASRGGTNITPWQLLDIQKGLSGGGTGGTQTTYDISETNPNDVRTYLNRVLANNLGRQATEDEFKQFLKQVQKAEAAKPSKTVTTTVGGVTKRKTTPGYGATDITQAAEQFSMQDPEYAQRQTETVFGDALVKALGIK